MMVDCDGDAAALLARMAKECPGLRQVFGLCADFDANADLGGWLTDHRVPASASTSTGSGEPSSRFARKRSCANFCARHCRRYRQRDPQGMFEELRGAVRPKAPLTPIPPTPSDWRIRNLIHLLAPIVVAAVA